MKRDNDYAELIDYRRNHRDRSTKEVVLEAFKVIAQRRGVDFTTVRSNCIRHQGLKGSGATDRFIRHVDRVMAAMGPR